MKTRTLKQLVLYNYRYRFAYAVIIGFVIYFLGWQLGSLGPGLAQPEIAAAAQHTNVADILHLPIYPLQALLQLISIKLLGVSPLTLRLPSALIALVVAFFLYQILKKWFGKSTALLSTAIFISADWFLFIARLGTGTIEFSLWLVLALFAITKLLEHKTVWLLLFAVSAVGLLFSPLGIYAFITLVASLLYCRVFRQRIHEASSKTKIGSSLIILTGFIFIGITTFTNFEFAKNLVGVQTLPSVTEYFKNVFYNTSSVAAILPSANPIISPSGIFFVRFFEMTFILFGVVMLWRTRVNRLNLTVIALTIVLTLASGLSTGARGGSVILVPTAIFMTAGIRHLMHRWKRTFPKNPYARVAAYLPLGVLFICVVSMHYFSYFELWPTQSSTHIAFTRDFQLLHNELNQSQYKDKSCLIKTEEESIQKLLQAQSTICHPVFSSPASGKEIPNIVIAPAGSVMANTFSKPLVSETQNNALRWTVFTRS